MDSSLTKNSELSVAEYMYFVMWHPDLQGSNLTNDKYSVVVTHLLTNSENSVLGTKFTTKLEYPVIGASPAASSV